MVPLKVLPSDFKKQVWVPAALPPCLRDRSDRADQSLHHQCRLGP